MRRVLRWLAVGVALGVVVVWAALGHHRGWTQNKVFRSVTDPVTGIDQQIEEKTFIPGVDFLGAGIVVAGMLGVSSYLFRTSRSREKG